MGCKYICRDCDFIFYIGFKPLKKGNRSPFCPNCGECISTEKCKIHRRKQWTTNELILVDKIINGELSKIHVAELTGRTYGAIQRAYEKRRKSKGDVV